MQGADIGVDGNLQMVAAALSAVRQFGYETSANDFLSVEHHLCGSFS